MDIKKKFVMTLLMITIVVLAVINIREKQTHLDIERDLIKIIDTLSHRQFIKVNCSVYNATPNQGWGDGTLTFNSTKLKKEISSKYRIISVSHDLLDKFPMGTLVVIEGLQPEYNGVYIVADLMNGRFKNKIDFLKEEHTKHPEFSSCFISKI